MEEETKKKTTTKKNSGKKSTTKKTTNTNKTNKKVTKTNNNTKKTTSKKTNTKKTTKKQSTTPEVKETKNKFAEIIEQEKAKEQQTSIHQELAKEVDKKIKEEEIKPKEETKEEVKEEISKPEVIIPNEDKKEEITSKEKYYDIFENEKSHPIIKFIIVLLILLAGVLCLYKFVLKSPKAIFSDGLNIFYKESNKLLNIAEENNIFKNPTEIYGVLKVASTIDEYKDLSDYNYIIDFQMDNNNKNYLLDFEIKNNDTSLSNIASYYLDNNLYIDFKDNFDKLIKLNNDITKLQENISNIKIVDYKKLDNSIKQIKNSIVNSIKNEQIITDKETHNDIEYDTTSIKLTSEEYSSTLTNIIKSIKDNNSLMNNLATSLSTNTKEIENYLDEILKNNLKPEFNNIELKFYSTGIFSKVVGFSIKIDDEELINYIKEEKQEDLYLFNKAIYINNKYENKTNTTIKINNEDFMTITFNENNKEVLDFDYKIIPTNNFGNFHLDKFNKEANKSGNIKFSIVTNESTSSFNFDYRLKEITEIKTDKEIISIDSLTEDDYITIINNITSKLKNTPFKDITNNLLELLLNY